MRLVADDLMKKGYNEEEKQTLLAQVIARSKLSKAIEKTEPNSKEAVERKRGLDVLSWLSA